MNRLSSLLLSAALLGAAGCSKKPDEIPTAVKAEAAMLINEAQFASQVREFARAEELVGRALELRDDLPEYWVTLGMARRQQDNKSGARKAYEKALALHTANYKAGNKPEELAQQAFVLGLLGRTDEAIKLLQQGLRDHPDNAALKKMADPRGLPNTFKSPKFLELMI